MGAYTYDVNGVRYTKTADGVTTTYFYDGNTLLGENRSDGTRLRYFYDATGICGFSYYNGSDTKYYTYVKDVLGNIVMIKDDMGLPLVKYTYNEWGICSMTAFNLDNQGAAALELGNLNPFRYRGYYYDSESGLYYLMTRYYDTQIGRFISPDTPDYLKPDTIGGVDLYAYCKNNPVMYVDPTGHFVLSAWMVGALVGFGVSFVSSLVSQALTGESLADGKVWAIATIDGVFGGISGALATIPGLGPFAYASIDAGLTFVNGLATALVDHGDLTRDDWISSAYSAVLSFASSSISRYIAFKGGEKEVLEKLNKQTKTVKGRINSGYYMKKGGYRSISDASRSVNKAIMGHQFGKGFYWDYVVDFAQTYSGALFGLGLAYLN